MKEKKTTFYDRWWEKAVAFYNANQLRCDLFFVVLMFAVLLLVRVNDIRIKNQLHSDEVFSLMLSTCNEYYHNNIPDGSYSGKELKTMITLDDKGGFSGAVEDIGHLWVNNGDAPHASLYYMVLRLALIGFDEFDVQEFSWRGGILNLFFFSLSFFLMYKLLRCIFGRRSLLVFVGLAVAFGNFMSIRNTLLIREYQMAETGIIALTLLGVSLVLKLREKQTINWQKFGIGFALVIAYVISLGYFNAVYVLLFGMGIMYTVWHYGERKGVLFLLLSAVGALVVAWIMYPGFFNFLLHESVHRERAFSSVRNIFRYVFIRDIGAMFFTRYGLFVMAGLLLVVIFSKNVKRLFRSPNFAWIPVIVVLSMLFILYASILKMPRYYYPLMPMFALIVPHIISAVPKSWKGYFEILLCLYFPIIVVLYPIRENYRWAQLKHELDHPVTFYKLNPNEVVQLIPCTGDEHTYRINNAEAIDISTVNDTYIVTKKEIGMNNDSIRSGRKLVWGRNIYQYKFTYLKNKHEEK